MAKIYIETSIPSYVTAFPSTSVVAQARQLLARDWWRFHRINHECFISELVLLEASMGDSVRAVDRLELLRGIEVLEICNESRRLASEILKIGALPEKAKEDSLHIATAAVHDMDFLVTWNCRHIANSHIIRQIRKHLTNTQYTLPEIATPEELIGA